ncbi:hypothetical protein LXL04_035142 [Taraxacum kok-saghyz]
MEETSSPNKKRLMAELIRGRDSTKKLQNLLRRKINDDGSVSADDLVMKILGSFSDSLSVLSSCGSGVPCPIPVSTYVGSACSGDGTCDSGESEKKPATVVKDRRGCYKRRKTEDSRVEIVDKIEDGYAWRKYGQKEILNATFPRCYFRCTYKNEGCKALKQVQKLEDGSQMFHVTYYGHHTCQNIHKKTHMFSDAGALSCFLLDFEDSKTKHLPSSPSTITNVHITPSMEQEGDSNIQSDEHIPSSNYGQSCIASWNDIFDDGSSIVDIKFDDKDASGRVVYESIACITITISQVAQGFKASSPATKHVGMRANEGLKQILGHAKASGVLDILVMLGYSWHKSHVWFIESVTYCM